MSFLEELASQIWNEEGFQSDFRHLQNVNILAEMSPIAQSAPLTDLDALARLFQSALIFAECRQNHFQDAAKRISSGALRLLGSESGARDVYSLVQSRLRNFPALGFREVPPAPRYAPLGLQYEFVRARAEQTVVVAEDAHVFTPFQLDSWRVLNAGRSTALSAPTSAGKSYLLLLYIVEQFISSRAVTVAYIVPTRALINQVTDDALKEFSRRSAVDVTITSVPVDLSAPTASKPRTKTLFVLTQERLDALLIAFPNLELDIVVVDEAQILGDGSRGVLLESVIDRVIRSSPDAQFVFSGPMIGNPDYFGTVFNLKDYAPCATDQSPVIQNLVYLEYSSHPTSSVAARLVDDVSAPSLVSLELPIRLQTDIDRLSYLSFVFGRSGSSIVYAGGKADAEKIAIKIAEQLSAILDPQPHLAELIGFVKRHVHKDYALAGTLEKGVGFHYGHMPSLLRKQLEDHFKDRQISFLACTSTLLYGLNLPAKNIFMQRPTTGRGSPISGPDFWNLAGRAGRLGKELQGNVFLVDYSRWETAPVKEAREIGVTSALKSALVDQAEELSSFISDSSVSSEANSEFEITLGKLVLDKRIGSLETTISRYRSSDSAAALNLIVPRIEEISRSIDIPTEVLNKNIGVSVFRQLDLLNYMIQRLKKLNPEELVPAHPLGDFNEVRRNYLRAFKRIHTYLLKYSSGDKRHRFFSGLALRWMRGDPLPKLIDGSIRYNREQRTGRSTARIIRDTMENIEDDLRFRYVKYFTCYNSVLEVALKQTNNEIYIATIPNIPLFLEMGGSSGAMINLMALGLSRTTAESLSDYLTDKDMNVEEIRSWVTNQNFERFDMSPICVREAEQLKRKLRM